MNLRLSEVSAWLKRVSAWPKRDSALNNWEFGEEPFVGFWRWGSYVVTLLRRYEIGFANHIATAV